MSANGHANPNHGGGPLLTILLGMAVIATAVVLVLTVKTPDAVAAAGPTTVAAADKADKKAEKKPAKKAKAAKKEQAPAGDPTVSQAPQAKGAELEPLPFELPNPVFAGTPKDIPAGTRMLKPTGKSREPFRAPKGLKNVAAGKKVTSSDANPIIGSLDLVTDADKEALDGRWVELAPGIQWVQIDLGEPTEAFAILLWHLHAEPQVYRDVIIKASNDPDFLKDVTVVFNNDYDNSAGQGKGEDYEYFEDFEGKLFDPRGVTARYWRFYSNGSTSDDQNRYTEVEIWGRPAKK